MSDEVATALFDLQEPLRDAADIVQALRMMGSSEEVPEDQRGPLITIAGLALEKLEWVAKREDSAIRSCRRPSDCSGIGNAADQLLSGSDETIAGLEEPGWERRPARRGSKSGALGALTPSQS